MSGTATTGGRRLLSGRYPLLLSAFVVSGLGNWIYRLALPLLVLKFTGSALNTAAIYAVEYAPLLVLSVPGGVFADRFDRRRVLIAGDLAATALAGLLAVLVATGTASVWPVYLVALLLACVDPLYYPAFQGMVPSVVPDAELERANAWLQAGDNVMSLLGPAVAGVLIAALGYESAMLVDAGTFAASALAILLIRSPGAPAAAEPRSGVLHEVSAVLSYLLRQNRVLLSGAILFALANLGTWLVQANLVYYLRAYHGMSSGLIGVVFAAQGAGAVLGAAVYPRLAQRLAPGRVIIAGTVSAGTGIVALVAAHEVIGISVLWALIYGIGTVNMVSWFVLRQRTVPPELLGRAIATTRMVVFVSVPVAAILGGALEQQWHNMYLIIALAGALRALAGLAAVLTPLNSAAGWVLAKARAVG